jgi:hypothetical protein
VIDLGWLARHNAVIVGGAAGAAGFALVSGPDTAAGIGVTLAGLGVAVILLGARASLPNWIGGLLIICATVAFIPTVTPRIDARMAGVLVLAAICVVTLISSRASSNAESRVAGRDEP